MLPSFVRTTPVAHIDYDKVIKVFTSSHMAVLYDRQAAVLEKIAKINEEGIKFSELSHVSNILLLCKSKIEGGGSLLLKPLNHLLSICSLPFREMPELSPTSDSLIEETMLVFADALASLTTLPHQDVVDSASHIIYFLISGNQPQEFTNVKRIVISQILHEGHENDNQLKSSDTRYIHNFMKYFERPTIIGSLTKSLMINDGKKTQLTLLSCFRRLSMSPISCNIMISSGSLQKLVKLLSHCNENIAASSITEIIWNMLCSPSKEDAAACFNIEGIHQLQNILTKMCVKNQKNFNSSLRNDIAIIILTVLELSPTIKTLFLESGFTDSLVEILKSHDSSMRIEESQILTGNNENFEFKRILINLIINLSRHRQNLQRILEGGILCYFLSYLDDTPGNRVFKIWSARQLKSLQLQIMGYFSIVMHLISDDWTRTTGNTIILNFLRAHLNIKFSTENGCNVVSDDLVLVGAALNVILTVTELGPSHKKILGANGLLITLMDILNNPEHPSSIIRTAFLVCSSLCQGCKVNKAIFGEVNGVASIIPFLTYSSPDPKETESIHLTSIECIWGSVCGNRVNEATFFQSNGLFALLDLLEKSSPLTQKHILGCILDLMENPKARGHVLEWKSRSNGQNGIAHLLIQIWCEEEARLGVKNGAHGIISNKESPLAGTVARPPKSQPSTDGLVIDEISENLRAKIYAMFCKLGFDHFHEVVSPSGKVKLALIAKYLDFKIGEVWEEISAELDHEGIRPVSPDLECIVTAKNVILEKAQAVQSRQYELVRKKYDIEHNEERHFYANLLN